MGRERLTARFYMNGLSKAQKLLKTPKMRRPLNLKWDKEFEYNLFSGDRMREIIVNKVSIEAIIKNQFDKTTKKLKIKCRKNCIQIERIGQ